jgi:hypothetical protein
VLNVDERGPNGPPGDFPHVTQGEVARFPCGPRDGEPGWLGGPRRAPAAGFGVDRLSLSFPVRSMADDPGTWPMATVREKGTAGESWTRGRRFTTHDPATGEVGAVTVFVGVTEVQGQLWGKVEANPSRFADPGGCSLLPLDRLQDACQVLASTAQLVLEPSQRVEQWRVKRADLARDFRGIGAPGFYVGGLLHVHRPYARRTYIYSDPSKGNAQTLWAGGKGGGCRLYDQHEAYAHKGAPEGSLRWEVEARGGNGSWLEKVGLGTVGDLVRDTAPLERLAESRWEWSGMGREIGSVAQAVVEVQGLGLSTAKRQRLLGALLEEACGIADTRAARGESAVEYRRLKRELGYVVVPAIDTLVAAGAQRGRLDWDSGTEIAA